MRRIILEELRRALAIAWGTMILLSFWYVELGWSSELILLIAAAIGLLSFAGFASYRTRSGRALKLRTTGGWVVFGTTVGILMLAYYVFVHAKTAPSWVGGIPILLGFILLVAGTWLEIRRANPKR
jgi:phosphatidylserine synthase